MNFIQLTQRGNNEPICINLAQVACITQNPDGTARLWFYQDDGKGAYIEVKEDYAELCDTIETRQRGKGR